MATQTIVCSGPQGLTTPTIRLFAEDDGDTAVGNESAVAGSADPSFYSADFTDIPAGDYRVVLFSGSDPVAFYFVALTLTTATFRAGEKAATGNEPVRPDVLYRWRADDDGETHDVSIDTI